MTEFNTNQRIVVGVSGASGVEYSRRLMNCLCDAGIEVHAVVTPHGARVLRDELGITEVSALTLLGHFSDRLTLHAYDDVGSKLASGSFRTAGMIVCPCSGHRLAALAAGLADNLLDRAAAVTIKEGRRLVLVPREMPMSRIALQNALRLCEAGAVICPAAPGFYMRPTAIADLVDFVVGRLLDLMNVPHRLHTRWDGSPEEQRARSTQAAGQ